MTSRLHKGRRRAAMVAALAAALGGCSSDNAGGDWKSMFEVVRGAWANRDASVELAEAASIPYATMGVRIGDGRQQIIVLATDAAGERLWTSAARIAITTRGGRIVATAGFAANLAATSSFAESAGWTVPHHVRWMADFTDLDIYSVPVECDGAPAGRETIAILGKDFDTLRVDESCRAERLDWTFNNTYWVSPDSGRVWRSRQYIHPNAEPLEIEILRPPESAG